MERLARTTTPSLDKRKTIKFETNGFQKASFTSASNSSLRCVIQCGSLCLESLVIALVLHLPNAVTLSTAPHAVLTSGH